MITLEREERMQAVLKKLSPHQNEHLYLQRCKIDEDELLSYIQTAANAHGLDTVEDMRDWHEVKRYATQFSSNLTIRTA